MEVLDPSVSRDDAPLTDHDSLQKASTSTHDIEDSKACIKSRQVFGFLGFMGFALVYAMRVNLTVAIVSMVNQTNSVDPNDDVVDSCPYNNTNSNNSTIIPSKGEFNWDEKTQGLILGAFFLGYVMTNVPGGRLAEKKGGKLIYGLGVFLTSVLTVISPFAAYMDQTSLGLYPFLIIRVAEGITEGVTYPSMHTMLAHWIPPCERSKFAALVYAGANFGTVISLPVAGYLCSLDLWGGWPLSFYLFGILGMIWYVFWLLFVYDTPAQHPRIDPQERAYIESKVEPKHDGENDSVPWLSIFTSLPMWAIAITQCGQAWAFYTLLNELPTYMDRILHFDVQKDAFLSALPYFTPWILGLFLSAIADALLARNILSPLTSLKVWNTVSCLGPSLSFLGAIWAKCDRITVMFMLSGFGAFYGAVYAGNQINHIALAPRYAGTLYGITNSLANTCGFLAPYIIGQIVNGHESLERWHTVFLIAAVINMGGNCFYLIFASASEQSWSRNRS
ncbi:sialin [Trichogramma pretiosum]|uniref:sialin n=1 Tax=Trichogramma pretiosum TaxID=7493 RepID=UPI0006C96389|nr:sialin [Trichogramma pretiosum]